MRATLLTFALVLSVAAASASEFYVVQATDTLQCILVKIPPATTANTLLANGRVFFDEKEARAVMLELPSIRCADTKEQALCECSDAVLTHINYVRSQTI
jgi:hypothetical protein